MPVAGVLSGALVWGLIWYPYRVLQEVGISGRHGNFPDLSVGDIVWRVHGAARVAGSARGRRRWAMLLVLSAGWANLGYVLGMLHGEVMRVLLLFYLAPVWTILFSYWLLRERLNLYGYCVVVLSLGGAWSCCGNRGWVCQLRRICRSGWGFLPGMGFALSNVVSRRAANLSLPAKSYSVWLGTALLTALLCWWQGGFIDRLQAIDLPSWLLLGLLGIVLCSSTFALQYAIANLSANRAIILFLFELVVAAISSYFLAGESLHLRDWLGALLIVAASLLSGKLLRIPDHSRVKPGIPVEFPRGAFPKAGLIMYHAFDIVFD